MIKYKWSYKISYKNSYVQLSVYFSMCPVPNFPSVRVFTRKGTSTPRGGRVVSLLNDKWKESWRCSSRQVSEKHRVGEPGKYLRSNPSVLMLYLLTFVYTNLFFPYWTIIVQLTPLSRSGRTSLKRTGETRRKEGGPISPPGKDLTPRIPDTNLFHLVS